MSSSSLSSRMMSCQRRSRNCHSGRRSFSKVHIVRCHHESLRTPSLSCMARADDDFLQLARDRFDQAQQADQGQRSRELEDLQTYAGNVWTADELKARGAQPSEAGMPPIPARQSLSIPLLQEPVKQVVNDLRAAELGVEIVPVDDFPDGGEGPDDREIELREGLVRRIQRESEAADARIWAAARAVQAGRGFWGVMTAYLPGKTWDQDIKIIRFYNQASVSLDPSHESPDGADAEWAFVGNDLPWNEYKARYGATKGNYVTTTSLEEFRALGDEAPGWFTTVGDTRICRVVDYWYTTRTTRELVLTAQGVYWSDELPAGLDAEDRREVIEKAVRWAQLDGAQVLDRTDWPGPDVPIIKVLGEELQPYDQERRAQGMVRPAKDSIKGFAAMVSKMVEEVGLTPPPSWQATPEQVEGFEKLYQMAASRALPVLFYNSITLPNGQVLPPPQRMAYETNVQAIAGAIQLFRDTLQSTTAVHDASLGKVVPNLRSARAVDLYQKQSEQSTSGFAANYKRSLRREGHIVNNLLYPVYGKRPGRIARIVTAEGEPVTVAINGPAPPPMGRSMTTTTAPKPYQLTEGGSFNAIVKVGKSFDSIREQEASTMGELLSANPVFMTWFGDLFFKNSDGPGHLELAERAKVMLDPKIQQMLQSKEQGTELPPQVQGFIQQLQQRVQQAEQIMQAQQKEIDTKQAAAKVQYAIAQLSAEKDIQLQQMRDATAIAVAKINALTKGVISDIEAEVERLALAAEQDRTAAQMAHETRTQGHEIGAQHAHDLAMQQAEHQQELQRMTVEHGHTLEEQQQAADLAPEPEGEPEPT